MYVNAYISFFQVDKNEEVKIKKKKNHFCLNRTNQSQL